ncbi:MAG: hypothetical protein NT118_02150 [Lentisphaerae bacterium]|nr:hypothetical protein [Lentisphaerota bacterium]
MKQQEYSDTYRDKYGYKDGFDRENWRGGYNPWNVSWIIAPVLEAALNFKYEEYNKKVKD